MRDDSVSTGVRVQIFDSFLKSLSPTDRARYESALNRYEQIQDSTVVRKIAALTFSDLKYFSSIGYDDFDKLHSYFKSVARSAISSDELFSSSLFRRLLDGKEPMPFPPPLSFSFPWYDIVEGTGPWSAIVASVDECSHIPYLRRYLVNPSNPDMCVVINEALWRIIEVVSSDHLIVTQPDWVDIGFKRHLMSKVLPDNTHQWSLCI